MAEVSVIICSQFHLFKVSDRNSILRYIGFVNSNREGPPFTAIVGKVKEICAGASIYYVDAPNNHFCGLDDKMGLTLAK